jgi:hypothetical protein
MALAAARLNDVAPMSRLVIWTNRELLKTKENKPQQDATQKGPSFSAKSLIYLVILVVVGIYICGLCVL